MYLGLALMWTFVLITDIISCYIGNEPSWVLVFCPLIILVIEKWEKYFNSR